jgi:replicative superfamily II helicase
VLVGAPTGSGKTVIAELAVLRILENRKKEEEKALRESEEGKKNENDLCGARKENGSMVDVGKAKIVYIGPMKALVHERVKDWREKFEKKLGNRPLLFFEFFFPCISHISRRNVYCGVNW